MHCSVSGCSDFLVQRDEEAIDLLKRYIQYMPQGFQEEPTIAE